MLRQPQTRLTLTIVNVVIDRLRAVLAHPHDDILLRNLLPLVVRREDPACTKRSCSRESLKYEELEDDNKAMLRDGVVHII